MANPNSSKNNKWFPNKALMNLSLHRLRRPKKSPQMMEHTQDCCFREIFLRFDADGDGRISSEELRSLLAWAGNVLSIEEVAELVRDLDSDGDGFIDYKEFVGLVGNGGEYGGGAEEGDNKEDLRRAFEMFEGAEKSGCITPSGLQRVLGSLGETRTEEECISMIRAYDLDGNGVLDYHEFLRMMG